MPLPRSFYLQADLWGIQCTHNPSLPFMEGDQQFTPKLQNKAMYQSLQSLAHEVDWVLYAAQTAPQSQDDSEGWGTWMQVRLFLAKAARRCTTGAIGLTGVHWEEAGSEGVTMARLGAIPACLACREGETSCCHIYEEAEFQAPHAVGTPVRTLAPSDLLDATGVKDRHS